ncbi:putative membrane protein [Escherichia coli T234_00]|nr:putative membrane protein [Escherichia coli T234_00]
MYRRTSTLAWLLPRYLWSKKKPALSGAGFFLCFLYASARTVTSGNGNGDGGGDGGGNGGANAFHGCCVLCNFYLSVRYAYIG